MDPESQKERIAATHNTARYFVEHPQVSLVLLFAVLAWGVYGYLKMPQRKDPDVPIRVCLTVVTWPGQSAERIEQLVTKKVEEKISQNAKVSDIWSVSRNDVAYIYSMLQEGTLDNAKQFDDIKQKLDGITDLPQGAGPIQFIKDFGDTAALLLTVASPPSDPAELEQRAAVVRDELLAQRARTRTGPRMSIVLVYPRSLNPDLLRGPSQAVGALLEKEGAISDVQYVQKQDFVALDFVTTESEAQIQASVDRMIQDFLRQSDLDPDVWGPVTLRNPAQVYEKLATVAGDRYTYRQLDDFTEAIVKNLRAIPAVARISRTGVLDEQVNLTYSRDRLAGYGLHPGQIAAALQARNTSDPGGEINVGGQNLNLTPTGEFLSQHDIGNVIIGDSMVGAPVYLRDIFEISRTYQSPARYLNFLTWRDKSGEWRRTRGITIAINMRPGEQISQLGKELDDNIAEIRKRLPPDLIVERTSDQPRQVHENVDLFMTSLWEAVILVVLVSLVGFWEWRSALLMALAIPITLAMTFGAMQLLGLDLQQVSIATLIIALGLLVDDPVVAGDAIKRDVACGHPPMTASWWGPTRLARAILFATITNIVAYLPFLMLKGDVGNFIFTLPVVITISLVASRIVSMTFIPFLGCILIRGKKEPPIRERRNFGFARWYYRVGGHAIRHRKLCLLSTMPILALGGYLATILRPQFFPKDLQYLSYVDVWLPEDASVSATAKAAESAEAAILKATDEYRRKHNHGLPVLRRLTSFIGGSAPRFWFSVPLEPPRLNYAQIIVEVTDKRLTAEIAPALQNALSASVPGARVDMRQLETGKPVGIPVSIRISGNDAKVLRQQAERLKNILRSIPSAERVRDNWGEESLAVRLKVDADRANIAGITNQDVADSTAGSIDGQQVGVLREGDREIPIVAITRVEERSVLGDISNTYVYSRRDMRRVPLRQVASLETYLRPPVIQRYNQYRAITVSAFPADGYLPSDVLSVALPRIQEVSRTLPPGYRLEITGEDKEQKAGFRQLGAVMWVSIVAIFLALVIQFKHAIKPLIVFAAIPYGAAGALVALWMMGQPFGFMAFLGVAALIGVIVSHIIVLFDYIEEKHDEGEPLKEALLDAGILRLRPVLITVGATVIALFPLALHGGPLWEPLCFAQIGGLLAATAVTLLLVPVLYSVFVLDLKWVKWEACAPLCDSPAEEIKPQNAVLPATLRTEH